MLPKLQSQGIGSRLLQQIIKISTKNATVRILLEVRVSNKKAIKLHASKGFKMIDTRKKYYRTNSNIKEDAYMFVLVF